MALDIRLYNASYLIELDDSSVYGVNMTGGFGMPQGPRTYSQSWGRGYAPLAAVDYQAREATLSIQLGATSLDNWVDTFRQIERLLLDVRRYWAPQNPADIGKDGDRAVLSYQLDGMSFPLEWEILDGECNADAILNTMMTLTTAPRLLEVPIPLRMKPFGRPQALTNVMSGTLNNGGGTGNTAMTYGLAGSPGDQPSPLRLSVQPTVAGWRRVIIGKKSRGNTSNFIAAFHADTASTPGGYSVANIGSASALHQIVANTSAHGGNVNRFRWVPGATSSSPGSKILRWTINDNLADFYGQHRAYLRIEQFQQATGVSNTASNPIQFTLSYGGTSGDLIINNPVSPDTSTKFLLDMGIVNIPSPWSADDVPLDAFRIVLQTNRQHNHSDTIWTDLDALFLVPIDEGFADILLNSQATSGDQLRSDPLSPLPSVAVVSSAGNAQQITVQSYTHTFFAATPGQVNLFVPLVINSTLGGHGLTEQMRLSFQYHPSYALGRTT